MINGIMNNSPVREIKGKVELYDGSTLLNTFTYRDNLSSFTVDRMGTEGKFFGFGITHKITVKLLDKNREININKSHSIEAYITTESETSYYSPYPIFYVDEVSRDENTNELTIVAYDLLYEGGKNLYDITQYIEASKEIEDGYVFRIYDFAQIASLQLGLPMKSITLMDIELPLPPIKLVNMSEKDTLLLTEYPDGANLEGTETVKDILDDIAEFLHCIYYLNNNKDLVLKRLDKDGESVLTIGKDLYFTLKSEEARTLNGVVSATALGNNISHISENAGETQYFYDNMFIEKKNDDEVASILETGFAALGGISFTPFDCSWRGNYLLEPGDKIGIVAKDDSLVETYLITDTIEYTGAFSEKSSWKYESITNETTSNPTTLGEALKLTYAKVDKANGNIEMLASKVGETETQISELKVATEGISASVSKVETDLTDSVDGIGRELSTLETKVEAKMTSEEVSILVKSEVSNGVDKVETSEKGFTFNDDGLTVSDSQSDMKTTITEDGMTVYRNGDEVLIADNEGVKAEDLHATSFLIIGSNSRFEDYGNRTGCFWIGG